MWSWPLSRTCALQSLLLPTTPEYITPANHHDTSQSSFTFSFYREINGFIILVCLCAHVCVHIHTELSDGCKGFVSSCLNFLCSPFLNLQSFKWKYPWIKWPTVLLKKERGLSFPALYFWRVAYIPQPDWFDITFKLFKSKNRWK